MTRKKPTQLYELQHSRYNCRSSHLFCSLLRSFFSCSRLCHTSRLHGCFFHPGALTMTGSFAAVSVDLVFVSYPHHLQHFPSEEGFIVCAFLRYDSPVWCAAVSQAPGVGYPFGATFQDRTSSHEIVANTLSQSLSHFLLNLIACARISIDCLRDITFRPTQENLDCTHSGCCCHKLCARLLISWIHSRVCVGVAQCAQ